MLILLVGLSIWNSRQPNNTQRHGFYHSGHLMTFKLPFATRYVTYWPPAVLRTSRSVVFAWEARDTPEHSTAIRWTLELKGLAGYVNQVTEDADGHHNWTHR